MKRDFMEWILIPEQTRIPLIRGWIYRFVCKKQRKYYNELVIKENILNKEERKEKITLSLTSFPGRIDKVAPTIKSLMMQSCKPDRIILWLAEEQFPDHKLPESILQLMDVGLEVMYCENLNGHKRHYKMLNMQEENEVVITFDDDILFPRRCVERIMEAHEKFPNCVICDRGQNTQYDKEGNVLLPAYWSITGKEGIKQPTYKMLLSPGGGCLFPKNALHKDFCDVEKIRKYALNTGNVWLTFMAAEKGTKIVKTDRYHRPFITIEDEQEIQLGVQAITMGRYEQTLNMLKEDYPLAYDRVIGLNSTVKKGN